MSKMIIECDAVSLNLSLLPVFRYRLQCHEALSQSLNDAAYREREADQRGVNYQGESTYHTRDALHANPDYAELLAVFDAAIADRWLAVGWTRTERPWQVSALWVNISKPGNLTHEHAHWAHAGAVFGGVYYSKAPAGCGSFRGRSRDLYCASIGGVELADYAPFDVPHWLELEPSAGDLILFPNWLWHSVTTNRSNDDRIAWTALFQIAAPIGEANGTAWRTTDTHPVWRDLKAAQ